jgi:LysR family transcriptional regulator, low CO2-responsive transcriptional regulator
MKETLKADIRGVTLRQLRALAAVAEAGTVSGAAERLAVTPPAVSLQLRLLEDAAGLPLLERTGSGLRLTSAGREVVAAVARIEASLGDCAQALDALHGMGGGRVAVGVVSTAKYFAPRALAAFAREHPRVDVRLHVGNRDETIGALRAYDLDLAVTGRPPEDFQIDRVLIGDHPHVVIAPPDHPLAGRRGLATAALAHETFLTREPGSGTRLLMERFFAASGTAPRLGMEMASNETIKQAVIAGLGIAFISAHTVAAELADGRLALLEVEGLPVVRQWFVAKHSDKRLLPAAQGLWDFFARSGAAFLPDVSAWIRAPADSG